MLGTLLELNLTGKYTEILYSLWRQLDELASALCLLALPPILASPSVAALKIANHFGMGQTILEPDALNLCQALKDEDQDNGVNASIICEAKELLLFQFDVANVMYCNRAVIRLHMN